MSLVCPAGQPIRVNVAREIAAVLQFASRDFNDGMLSGVLRVDLLQTW